MNQIAMTQKQTFSMPDASVLGTTPKKQQQSYAFLSMPQIDELVTITSHQPAKKMASFTQSTQRNLQSELNSQTSTDF